MNSEFRLSVIVPVYNEHKTIGMVLESLLEVKIVSQIIVVDDRSVDGTRSILGRFAKMYPEKIILLENPKNRGKGYSIRIALTRVTGTHLVIQDADMEYDPKELIFLAELSKKSPSCLVLGSRRKYDPIVSFKQLNPFYLCNSILNFIVFVIYGVRISDEATCYKMGSLRFFQIIDLQCEQFEFCPEVIAKACQMQVPILEVPISYKRRRYKEGKKIRFKDSISAVYTLLRYRNWKSECSLHEADLRNVA